MKCPVCSQECTNNSGLQSHLRRERGCSARNTGGPVTVTIKYVIPQAQTSREAKKRSAAQTGGWVGNTKP